MTQTDQENIVVPPSAQALAEAEVLSGEILRDIELSQIPLSLVVLKALRLARIVNDFEAHQIFEWESGGYPQGANGVTHKVWATAVKTGRVFFWKNSKQEERTQHMYRSSIEELESDKNIGGIALQAAGNPIERRHLRSQITTTSGRLASRRTFIYNYASRKYYELNFGSAADDAFDRIRSSVDSLIGKVIPDAVRKFSAIYDNLKSENPEDWANAVHGCRRVLLELADAVFPPQAEPRRRIVDGKEILTGLGPDHYKNRLIAYVEKYAESERFEKLVGSELSYMVDRLDALIGAANKGSHADVSREEADRCVVYTYLTVGDILSLGLPEVTETEPQNGDIIGLEVSEQWDPTEPTLDKPSGG